MKFIRSFSINKVLYFQNKHQHFENYRILSKQRNFPSKFSQPISFAVFDINFSNSGAMREKFSKNHQNFPPQANFIVIFGAHWILDTLAVM